MSRLNAEYHAYIASPEWAAKRKQYWATVERCCQACGSTKELHCHHMTYDRFMNEHLEDLIGVCKSCHEEIHAIHRKLRHKVSLFSVTKKFVQNKNPIKKVTYVQPSQPARVVAPDLSSGLFVSRPVVSVVKPPKPKKPLQKQTKAQKDARRRRQAERLKAEKAAEKALKSHPKYVQYVTSQERQRNGL